MDQALLKQHELFKKRAAALPVVENRKSKEPNNKTQSPNEVKKKVAKKEPTTLSRDPLSYARSAGSSPHNFAILHKIVKHMKRRHLDGDNEPLTFEEMLDETNQLDIASKQRHWLATEALPTNAKLELTPDGRYKYKPTFQIRNRKELLRLLDRYDSRGTGGISLEDVQESLPNADKAVKALVEANKVIVITRPDKKKILFYNDTNIEFKVDEEFIKLWRSIAVDGIDEQKIEEYLEKQGINSMQDLGVRKTNPVQKRKKPSSRKGKVFKKHNDHIGDILQDYSDK